VPSFVTLTDASARLPELVEAARRGEEVVLTQDDRPVARLLPVEVQQPVVRPGHAKGSVLYIADDFDAPLEEFREYME